MVSTYKAKVVVGDEENGKKEVDNARFVFNTLDDYYDYCSKIATDKKTKEQNDELDSEVVAQLDLREQLYGVLDRAANYWSQFGFMDNMRFDLNSVVSKVAKCISIHKNVDDLEDQDSTAQDEYDVEFLK